MTRRRSSVASPAAPSALLGDIRALIEAARKHAASTVNSELTMLYWRIGQRIHTQVLDGRRGAYGKEVLPTLAAQLVKEYGSSFAEQNLRRMVQFATTFPAFQIRAQQASHIGAMKSARPSSVSVKVSKAARISCASRSVPSKRNTLYWMRYALPSRYFATRERTRLLAIS